MLQIYQKTSAQVYYTCCPATDLLQLSSGAFSKPQQQLTPLELDDVPQPSKYASGIKSFPAYVGQVFLHSVCLALTSFSRCSSGSKVIYHETYGHVFHSQWDQPNICFSSPSCPERLWCPWLQRMPRRNASSLSNNEISECKEGYFCVSHTS